MSLFLSLPGMIMTMFNQGTSGFTLYGSKMKTFLLNCDIFHDMQVYYFGGDYFPLHSSLFSLSSLIRRSKDMTSVDINSRSDLYKDEDLTVEPVISVPSSASSPSSELASKRQRRVEPLIGKKSYFLVTHLLESDLVCLCLYRIFCCFFHLHRSGYSWQVQTRSCNQVGLGAREIIW